MKNTKKDTPLLTKVINVLKSKSSRNAMMILMLILSVLGMFMLDEGNYIRETYFTFLESNFIITFMSIFNISRYNISIAAWIVFFTIFAVILLFTLGDIFAFTFIDEDSSKFQKVLYYVVLTSICVGAIVIAWLLGAFDVILTSADVFKNLLYTLLICFLFIVLAGLAIIGVLYLVKGILLAFKWSVGLYKESPIDEIKTNTTIKDAAPIEKDRLFPSLVKIDMSEHPAKTENTEITLEEFALQFQSYAIHHHRIYYGLPLVRSFVSALATSRLIILEGLSGTGKSMLPRLFASFTNSNAFFAPVQATWRDKTDVLGFYSEFSKTFKSTQFLENLYSASYSDKPNVMVLDEMNLSRVEYYFADFLSVMEYPPEDWRIKIYEPQVGQKLPPNLNNGCVKVPTNTWFIGTANTDDSTFTITDKVYDRAVVIDFAEKVLPIESSYKSDPINVSADYLTSLFEKAQNDVNKCLTQQEIEKFFKLCDFMSASFDVRFGNRILVQIEKFVPVYVALGGSKEEALDFMFARKILRKVDGMFGDFVKDELINLTKLIHSLYGKNTFKESERIIAKFTKRLV